jgi:hypothetical protein
VWVAFGGCAWGWLVVPWAATGAPGGFAELNAWVREDDVGVGTAKERDFRRIGVFESREKSDIGHYR